MKLRVYGFCIDKQKAPTGITIEEVIDKIEVKSNLNSSAELLHGLTTLEINHPTEERTVIWRIGVILKVRDSKSFTKLATIDGRRALRSEQLAGEDSLAEASFFIVNPITGAGLYANHHLGASFLTGYGVLWISSFQEIQDEKISSVDSDPHLTLIAKRRLKKPYRGTMWPTLLVRPQDFKDLIKSLKRVRKIRLRYKSLKTGFTLFRGYTCQPKTEVVEYTMPENALPEDVAEALGANIDDYERATVHGENKNGMESSIKLKNNPQIFCDYDYDAVMSDHVLELDNFEESLRQSPVINELSRQLRDPVVWKMLNDC